MDVGELLRRHRTRLGLSQEDLAARAALSVRAIRDLERGRVVAPRAQSVHRLTQALGLTGADLDDLLAAVAAAAAPGAPASTAAHAPVAHAPAAHAPAAHAPVAHAPAPIVAVPHAWAVGPSAVRRRDALEPTDGGDRTADGRRAGGAQVARAARAGGRRDRPRIGVLGPLTVHAGGAARDVASTMRRALLGLLALHPHQIVAREEIVDTLWGPRPPRTCQSLVHVYIGQLRTLLEPDRMRREPARTVVLAGGGYRLEVEPDQVDAAEFDVLVARAHRARDTEHLDRALATYIGALEQWRGPVLADVTASVRHHPSAVALSQRRVAAALAMADVAGRLGRVDEALPWLRGLARDEALHEGLHARLMLALAASGEQAAALRVFAELRDRLTDELGIAPGAELQEAHVRVLRQEYDRTGGLGPVAAARPAPAGPRPPAQLPADVASFTGRAEDLRELGWLVDKPAEAAVVVAAITGTAGVGKTALAVHFGHRVRERFPDGQLYVNLRGYAVGPSVRPIEALAGFLVALGVPPEQVPLDVENAAALYRSLLADRRVLVLIDNASHPDDIRPLLPGGAGSVVLVTSRDQLAGLVARDGARRLSLDVLSAGEAHTLLGRLVGPDRVLAELQATAELATLCAGLPLALRIAAANLTGQRECSLARYAAQLRAGNRLAALVVDGDEETAVRAAFDLSYTALPEPARRVFRLLGLVPGPDATAEAAAALAGITPAEAARLLDRLVGAHLLDQHRPGRYAFHDLLRLYARTQSTEEDDEAERVAAPDRLYMFYLHRAHEAAQLLFGHMFRIPLPDGSPPPVAEPFAGHAPAMAWYDAERENILAATASANAYGPRRFAWLLVDAIRGYLLWRMYTVDWLAAARVGLAAAEAESDLIGQLAMLLSLGGLSSRQSRHQRALGYHTRAFEVAEAAGSLLGQAVAQTNLGGVYIELGQLTLAAVHLRASLELNQRGGFTGGRVNNHANLGSVSLYLGRLEEAAAEFHRSVVLAAELSSHTVHAVDLGNLAEAYCLLGRYDDAHAALTEALAAHRETGNRASEATTLRCMAYVEYERGRLGTALAIAEQAITHAAESGHRRAEAEALSVLATIQLALGEPRLALEHHRRAMRIARDTGHHYPEVDALIGMCRAERHLGRHTEALAHAEQALAAARQAEFGVLEGKALTELAELRREFGDEEAAWADACAALATQRRCGYRVGIAEIHLLRARLRRDRGEPDVLDEMRQAHRIYTDMGAAAATRVTKMIEAHESDAPGPVGPGIIVQNGQHLEGSIP